MANLRRSGTLTKEEYLFAFLTRADNELGKFASPDGVNPAYMDNLRPIVEVFAEGIPLYTIPYEHLISFEYTVGDGPQQSVISWFDQNVVLLEQFLRYLYSTSKRPKIKIRWGWYDVRSTSSSIFFGPPSYHTFQITKTSFRRGFYRRCSGHGF